MTKKELIITGVVAGVLGACGTSGPSAAPVDRSSPAASSASPAAGSVFISNSRFDPVEVSAGVGDTVTFTNGDPYSHTVTSKEDSAIEFDSGRLGKDETFQVTFDEAGTYAYFCQIHPTMRASVIVG